MRKKRFQLTGRTVGIIILAILLTAGLGIYICMKTYVMPEPEPAREIQIAEETRAFVTENEDLLRQAMASFGSGDPEEADAFFRKTPEVWNTFFRETPINNFYLEDWHDGVQLWTFELDSTSSSGALGGCYYNIFYCESNPRDKIYDWFGDRSGMWEDMGIAQRYRHNGNEIYLEKLENNFWFGYCYC